MKRSFPNLFVIGAPKCGTTSLYYYLGQHRDVYVPTTKEPFYYNADLYCDPSVCIRDREAYLDLFSGALNEKVLLDASVGYLYSREAPKRIAEDSPNAKFVVVLRNPTTMIHSLHWQCLHSLNEEYDDIEDALNLEAEREEGREIPIYSHFPMTLR